MHHVFVRILHLHRLEGACAHMQRHERGVDATRGERLHQRWREMQPRRGCGDGTIRPRINRLIILLVGRRIRPRDIRRQRNMPMRPQLGKQRRRIIRELDQHLRAVLAAAEHRRGEIRREMQHHAFLQLFRRARESLPRHGTCDRLVQQQLDRFVA